MRVLRDNAINQYVSTATATKVFDADPTRTILEFFAKTGDVQLVFGDGSTDFTDKAITIPAGACYIPSQVVTSEVWLLGEVVVLTSTESLV